MSGASITPVQKQNPLPHPIASAAHSFGQAPAESLLQHSSSLLKKCIHHLFEDQAKINPSAVAISFQDRKLTYGDLNFRANVLAHRLMECSIVPESLVAIYLERSPELIIAILGVLKSGGAYLPLDPVYPKERVAFMLEDTAAPVLITTSDLIPQLPEMRSAKIVCIDQLDWTSNKEWAENPDEVPVTPDNLAYVIYTSGSTGKPKGSMITHFNVVRLFTSTDHWFRFKSSDAWTLFHSCAFDFSVWEIWGALLFGGRLVVVSYHVSRTPEAFYRLLAQEEITVLNQTPSAFRQLMHAEKSLGPDPSLKLRYVIFGGEALDIRGLKPWFNVHGDQEPKLINMYGITETTVHVTYRPISRKDLEASFQSVIGIPISDLDVYVLDENQQPVGVGGTGEMYVGGNGVGRRYLNRPELTAQRFIQNPLTPQKKNILYRSGDLVRILPNGELDYLGRIDLQVKIRGFRIELGEIEAVMRTHEQIKETVVIAQDGQGGEKQLVAYIVPCQKSQIPSSSELRKHLGTRLPDYMIPAVFIPMDHLPLTPNGKIERKLLPDPGQSICQKVTTMEREKSPMEASLSAIWGEVLGLPDIGLNDNFYEMGGNSIHVGRIVTRIRKQLRIEVPLRMFFENPTVSKLAQKISGLKSS